MDVATPPSRSFARVMRIADTTISAGDLIGDQQLFTVRPGWTAARAHNELIARGFTQAPVTDVPIRRFVTAEALSSNSGTVSEASSTITPEMFIEDACPLGTTLDRLRSQPVLFVHHQSHTIGVLTVADLEQPAVAGSARRADPAARQRHLRRPTAT